MSVVKSIALACTLFFLGTSLYAQEGLGRLDHNGLNKLKPKFQTSVTPVNAKKALHFVLPGGSCSKDDCGTDRERSQMLQSRPDNIKGQSYRYSFSFFLPAEFPDIYPANTMLWEVKPFGNGKPSIMVEIVDSHLQFTMSNPRVSQRDKMNPDKPAIMKNMGRIPREKWTEMIIDVRWSDQKDGILTVYQNGQKIVDYRGANQEAKVLKQAVMFGIYRSFISRYKKQTGNAILPTQQAYFANVKRQEIRF